jgi:hypothetical protein
MNAWSWVPIGLAAWFGVSLAVGMWLGPVLMYCSRAAEAQGAHSSHGMGNAPPSGSKAQARHLTVCCAAAPAAAQAWYRPRHEPGV